MRGLHVRKLASDQEKTLDDYFFQLQKIGMSAHLQTIEQAANLLLRMSSDQAAPPFDGQQWAKRWLNRRQDFFKGKKKPLAAARKKNARS